MTSLHMAAKCGHVDVVVALLEGKADVAAMGKVIEQWRVSSFFCCLEARQCKQDVIYFHIHMLER